MNSLADPKVVEILYRLHRDAELQKPELRKKAEAIRQGGKMPEDWAEQLRDFYLPVSREQGRFLYQTVRGVRAERVVEFDSSFGISSIYLAAGLRDNNGGILIGSELVEDKAATARRNIAAAGLADYVEIRSGDARTTLLDPGSPVDVVLLDGGSGMYLDIVQLLQPHLRLGAVVLADNIEAGAEDEQPYAKWVRDPANGFVSSSIEMKGGTEYSVWVGTA
ncbi:MAG: class I SAM-dependent methyltransferase [Alphaproteobacteria bacterium]|nr:class I SAM-dependent methyltransferase [Alphaproteobacteria bacterium]